MITCIVCCISLYGCSEAKESETEVLNEKQSSKEKDVPLVEKKEEGTDSQSSSSSEQQKEKKEDEENVSHNAEKKTVPETPADEVYDDEDLVIGDPSEAQITEEITGVDDTDGTRVLEALKKYGISVTEGVEAPDGSKIWSLQNGNYTCDIQADVDGNIYNAVFSDSGDDYADFLAACAGIFNSAAADWVTENVNSDTATEIDSFAISISEGPGGHSLQICSLDYRETVVGPQ